MLIEMDGFIYLIFSKFELVLVNDLNIKNLYLFNHNNIINNILYSVLSTINNVNRLNLLKLLNINKIKISIVFWFKNIIIFLLNFKLVFFISKKNLNLMANSIKINISLLLLIKKL